MEPVIDPQWPAVITQRGAISVPVQPKEPPMVMFATYRNVPGRAAFPPTTACAGAGSATSAQDAAMSAAARRMYAW